MISIHALLAESDSQKIDYKGDTKYFYPRSPCGERRNSCTQELPEKSISIHALLAESDKPTPGILRFDPFISIHALLAESDNANLGRHRSDHNFYPRSPCGERRLIEFRKLLYPDFYPRSPCGERRNARPETRQRGAISIHALLAESDP